MIPVYSCIVGEREKKYLCQCIDKGQVSSLGKFVRKFEEAFAKRLNANYAIATSSGTSALETALWASGINKGLVILPTSTIISCVIAILRVGAKPLFKDIDLETLNIDISKLSRNPILSVNLFGHRVEHKTNALIIEDNSQYWEKYPITHTAVYSLYANKLITTSEGGVIVTNSKQVYDNAKSYIDLCHSKERFIHNKIGYNFRMSNLQAALGLAQLEQIEKFTEIKQRNLQLYKKYLPEKVRLKCEVSVPWMYLVETPYNSKLIRQKLWEKYEIDTRSFFYPLHKQPCFGNKYSKLSFPNADYASKHWFYLPSGLTLKEWEIKYICQCLTEILNEHF